MAVCRSCQREVPDVASICPHCHARLDSTLLEATETKHNPQHGPLPGPRAPATAFGSFDSTPLSMPKTPDPSTRTPPPAPKSDARFTAGSVIAARYRVIERIGKGGMGEVYRAEDMELNQQVAIKLLPESLSSDAMSIALLRNEVRIARRVTHKNVCRVHDVGQHDGHSFITMEFVEGEDLGTLVRRVGRLGGEKAVDIARQICVGLAAVHEQGVLHRDLKPGNILIDDKGHPKIADFGLGGLASELAADKARSGTPAYMAPEQLRGEPPSVRTDLYSLGLVLYELFTAKPVFRPRDMEDLLNLHDRTLDPPSALAPMLAAEVDDAVMACLEKDPERRPRSAVLVAAKLPGGDTLRAALEAGLTPTPELVAASGDKGNLSPLKAWLLFAGVVAALALMLGLSVRTALMANISLPKSPAVLADRAREMLRQLGYEDRATHEAYGLDYYEELIDDIARQDGSPARWERLKRNRPAPVDFWYRRAARPFVTLSGQQRVTFTDPPFDREGMVNIRLDPEGRLRELAIVPPFLEEDRSRSVPRPTTDTDLLFGIAGLDPKLFKEVEARRTPLTFADTRRAWEGVYPEYPDEGVRVEAAWLWGRIVAFRILETKWIRASTFGDFVPSPSQLAGSLLLELAKFGTLAGAIALAWRHIQRKRGDRAGAIKVSVVVAIATFVTFLLRADLPLGPLQFTAVLWRACAAATVLSGLVWVLYLALEPIARRTWPETLVGWSRLLSGRFTDPLIGQNLLIGTLAGVGVFVLQQVDNELPGVLGLARPIYLFDHSVVNDALEGGRRALGVVGWNYIRGSLAPMGILMALVITRVMLKSSWLALGALGAGLVVAWTLIDQASPASWILNAGIVGVVCWVMVRHGLLATIALASTWGLVRAMPMSLDLTAWYAPTVLLTLGVCLAQAVLGALIAQGTLSRPRGIRGI